MNHATDFVFISRGCLCAKQRSFVYLDHIKSNPWPLDPDQPRWRCWSKLIDSETDLKIAQVMPLSRGSDWSGICHWYRLHWNSLFVMLSNAEIACYHNEWYCRLAWCHWGSRYVLIDELKRHVRRIKPWGVIMALSVKHLQGINDSAPHPLIALSCWGFKIGKERNGCK
jgi:hypothetical protein